MDKPFIPLNRDQEEALCELYLHHGGSNSAYKILKYLEENLGKFHKHTVNVRLMINKLLSESQDKSQALIESSNLNDVLMKRLD